MHDSGMLAGAGLSTSRGNGRSMVRSAAGRRRESAFVFEKIKKATSWVVARSRRFIAWSVGISVTLLLPSITARAAGILIQVLTAVIAAGLKQFLNQAAEESNRIGSQLVKIAEDSLDICLSDEAPSPQTPSAAVASQVFSALANGSSAAEIFEKLSVPEPPAPSPTATWKLPGWMLLVAGIAARHYMP